MGTADELRELIRAAEECGYALEAVELPSGHKLRIHKLPTDMVPVRAAPLPRQPEESADAYAKRLSLDEAKVEREKKIARYTPELGKARATALADSLP
jgi:hypothetical protein